MTPRSLKSSLEVCAHLEDALSFDLDLTRALSDAPFNAERRDYIMSRLSGMRSIQDLTFALQLRSFQLLPPRANAQLEVADLCQRPHCGLSESRRILERIVQRRRSLEWIRRLPIYLVIHSLISATPSLLSAHRSMITLTTIVAMITSTLNAVPPHIVGRLSWAQWRSNWRRSWLRQARAHIERRAARLTLKYS